MHCCIIAFGVYWCPCEPNNFFPWCPFDVLTSSLDGRWCWLIPFDMSWLESWCPFRSKGVNMFLGALSLMSLDAPSLVELFEWFELSWVGISVQYMYHGKSASIYSQVVLLFCIWFLCWVAKCFFVFLSVATIEPVDLEIIATYVLNLDITELEPFPLQFQDTNWEASIHINWSQSVSWVTGSNVEHFAFLTVQTSVVFLVHGISIPVRQRIY